MSFRFRESFYCQNHADFVAGMMAQRHRVTAIFIERTAIVKYFGKQSDFVSWHRLPTMLGQSSRSQPVKHPFVSFMCFTYSVRYLDALLQLLYIAQKLMFVLYEQYMFSLSFVLTNYFLFIY